MCGALHSISFLGQGTFFCCCASKIVFHIKIDMAWGWILNPETPLVTPADVRQPFAAKDTYFVPKSESHLLFGKLDFAAGKTKSIKNMELLSSAQMRSARTAGSFLLDTLMNFTYKESGNPVIAISLRLCIFRSAHKDEIESFEVQI